MAARAVYFLLFLLLSFRNTYSKIEADFPKRNKTKTTHLKRDVLICLTYILMVATIILISCFCFLNWRIRRTRFIKKKVAKKNLFRSLFIQYYPAPIRKWLVRWFKGRRTRDSAVVHLPDLEYVTTEHPPTSTPLTPSSSSQDSIMMFQNSTSQPTEISHNYRCHLINNPSGPKQRSFCTLPRNNTFQCPSSFAFNQSNFPGQGGRAGEEIRDFRITIYSSNNDPPVTSNSHYKTA